MIAILSPHFDDAVLSCWSALTGPRAAVVLNVFSGAPEAGSGARWWDRMTGAADSAERMRERRDEDRAALALAGREAIDLGLLEEQYRDADGAPDLLGALQRALPPDCEIYAPAALGEHTDHALVRDAALRLRAGGTPVTLYADLPHAIDVGWPTWVADGAGRADVDTTWAAALRPAGLAGVVTEAAVVTLTLQDQARKVEALRRYATQFAALDALAFRPLLHPATLRYEVFWALD